ncbi:SCP2 domain-containing protein [Kangiella sp. HZ709]|uniref:ubiquinone biosynthesis accessory factor UbiJ n=1 Tax=Kangiella sp. HZ709 TaxID=2666328 RepID=UPI0012B08AA1|nr:SCP2 sterol-binding domain-containing protein [Kangiella sp. HZ709]MRX28261.1 sterol-binding protein [Kangiella sp. HZ709]
MLVSLFAPTIETVINQVIKLDPDAKARLFKLDGKLIKFELTDLKQSIYFKIEEDYIIVKEAFNNELKPNAELKGNSLSFFNLALSKQQDPLFKGEVIFSGEIQTAQKFQSFFEQLDIDWEEHLSKYTGDIVAHELFKASKSFQGWAMETLNTAKLNFSEYLKFEARATPATIELENFFDDVADLKSDVERIELKINRLLARKISGE